MLYKVKSGPVEERHYGLDLARVIGFPQLFIETAERVSKTLEEQTERTNEASPSRALLKKRKLVFNMHETLRHLQDSDIDDAALGSYMKRLQEEFIVRMEEIDFSVQPRESEQVEDVSEAMSVSS